MEIYLLRHGDAEDSLGVPDEERGLTPEGRRKLRAVLSRARAAGAGADLVLSSPLRRAQETAALAVEILGAGGPPLKTKVLLPGAAPAGVWDEVRVHRDQARLLLAGHEPILSRTVAYLVGAPEAAVDMKKAALARVDLDQFGAAPRGVLRWLMPPALAGGEA
jgi:phosphohistidine phosphatase